MKYLLILAPNLLTVIRLAAGPIFLLFGTVPTRGIQLLLLVVAAATDLVDGRLARALGATTAVGGSLDTVADKVFALCLLLKLMLGGVISPWIFWTILAQYLVLAAAGTAYTMKYHHIPVPEASAHTAAVIAVVAVLVGVVSAARWPTTMLCIALIAANLVHIAIAWLRVAGMRL